MKIVLLTLLLMVCSTAGAATYQVQGSIQQMNGKVYIGGVDSGKTQFDSYTLEGQIITEGNFLFGLSYDHFQNNRSVENSQLGLNLGYNFNFDKINLSLYGGPGIANYSEKSTLQSIETSSIGLSATASINYIIYEGLFVQVNYKYIHQMFTDGYTFWGKNPRTDIVFDNHGLGVGIGWRW